MKRRDFFKTTGLLAAGAETTGMSGCSSGKPQGFNFNRLGKGDGLKLSFEPYELELRHVFTVSSYSRKTTPGVQVRIDYEGFTGYGEASMPPYLGQTVESVCAFLSRTDLGQFRDPFRMVFGALVAALIVKYTKQARRRKIYAKRRRRK